MKSENNTKDKIKHLEMEFKSKFIESLYEQLDRKTELLKNQTNMLKKQNEIC